MRLKSVGEDTKFILILALLCVSTILLSNIISGIFNFVGKTIAVEVRLQLFTFSILVYCVFQYVILRYFRYQFGFFYQKESKIKKIYTCITIIQYFFILCLIVLLFQMFTNKEYIVILLTMITLVGYVSSSIILSILSIKLFYWIRRKSNRIFVLYVASIIILTINILSSLAYGQDWFLNQRPFDTIQDRLMSDDKHLPQNHAIFYIYSYSSIASFVLNYFAAMMLLKSYSTKSKIIYWIVISVPLFYFVSQYTSLNYFILKMMFVNISDLVLIYHASNTIIESLAGTLIGVSFLVTAKKVPNIKFRNSLYFCAIGYALVFGANYAINISNPIFPPFTVVGMLYVPMSTFLIFVGIYSAAAISANDMEVRRFIRKSVRESVLENIGRSEVEGRVLRATKDISNRLEEETGFTSSFEDEDVREYVRIVSTEINRIRKKSNKLNN